MPWIQEPAPPEPQPRPVPRRVPARVDDSKPFTPVKVLTPGEAGVPVPVAIPTPEEALKK